MLKSYLIESNDYVFVVLLGKLMFFGKIYVINLFKSLVCGECVLIVFYWKVY